MLSSFYISDRFNSQEDCTVGVDTTNACFIPFSEPDAKWKHREVDKQGRQIQLLEIVSIIT